jgi:CRP-like cAMP-binding protein
VRFRVPVDVAYGSDPRQVEKLLLEVASELPDVMKNPPPAVRLMSFGESSIHFELRVWNETRVHMKGNLISEINFRIFEKFDRYGIEIPYPQRDVHIKTMAAPSTTPASTAQQSIAEYLRHTRLFSVLSDEDLMELANSAIPRRFHRGQTIIEQDQEGNSMCVISRGVVAVKVRQPDGTITRVATLVRGEFFGEASMLTGEKRTATIVAESDVEAFEVSKEALQPILSKNPNLAEQLSHSLAAHQEQDKTRLATNTAAPKPETHTSRAHRILSRIRSVFDL